MVRKPTDITRVLAANVRRYRLRSGKSQTDLANEISMSRTNVVNIEAGRNSTSIDTLMLIAEALEVQPGDLLVEPERCPTCGRFLVEDLPEEDSAEATVTARGAPEPPEAE